MIPGITSIVPHPSPIYSLSVDGKDITADLDGRLVTLTLTDNRGFEADQLDIVLDDSDGKLALPPRGASLYLAIGWKSSGLIDKGTFTADEVVHEGAPDTITIRARSADLSSGLTTQRERSFHATTVGDIVRTIAAENKLTPLISPKLGIMLIEHLDQTNESSANLLTRMAGMFDAITTVKNGNLLFIHAGAGISSSGKPLPIITITRQDGDKHHFTIADRGNYTHVKATWNDIGGGIKGEVVWSKTEDEAEQSSKAPPSAVATAPAIEASADNIKILRHVYASKESARRAARTEWRRLQRGMAEFSLAMALGRPELFPEMPVIVKGFKREIDSTDWIITKATHSLSDAGLTTQLQFEIKATEIPG